MLAQWMENFVREQRRISAAAADGSAAVGGTGLWEEDVDDEQSSSAQMERSGGCGKDRSSGRGSGGDSRRGAGRGAGGGAVAGYPSMSRGANHAAARRVVVSDSDEEDDDGKKMIGRGTNVSSRAPRGTMTCSIYFVRLRVSPLSVPRAHEKISRR